MSQCFRTWRRFPVPGFNASNPPGPMLLLLDFFAAVGSEKSMVAFSLSPTLRWGDCPPTDLLVRRVAGTVASVEGAMIEWAVSIPKNLPANGVLIPRSNIGD